MYIYIYIHTFPLWQPRSTQRAFASAETRRHAPPSSVLTARLSIKDGPWDDTQELEVRVKTAQMFNILKTERRSARSCRVFTVANGLYP